MRRHWLLLEIVIKVYRPEEYYKLLKNFSNFNILSCLEEMFRKTINIFLNFGFAKNDFLKYAICSLFCVIEGVSCKKKNAI